MSGTVPTRWRRLPLKRIASLRAGDMIPSEEISEAGEYPVYGGNGIRGYASVFNRAGDRVLIGRHGALCGNVNLARGSFWATEHAVVVEPDGGTDARWLGALLSSMDLGRYSQSAAQPGLAIEVVANLPVAVPSLAEQRAIADYLDAETARIDALLNARRQQLVLGAERRFEASRALFADRSHGHARLPWLPAIPMDWRVVHLQWLVKCLDGRRIPVNREERSLMQGDVPYWGANGIVDHVDRALFDQALVLLGEDGAPFFEPTKAKAFFVNEPVWVNNHIHVLQSIGVRPSFLAHYLNLVDYSDFIEGSTRDKLTQDNMGAIPVPVPPMAVQEKIEREIDALMLEAAMIEAALGHQIDLLHERRQALITAAVRGQLEIPGVAA